MVPSKALVATKAYGSNGYGGHAGMVPANAVLARTLSRAHGCGGSQCMEYTQGGSQPMWRWLVHSAGPSVAMGHHGWRARGDGPGRRLAGIHTRPGPQ